MKRDHRIDVRPDIGHKAAQEDDDFELVDGQKISYMTVAEYPVSEYRGGAMLQPYWDGRCVFQFILLRQMAASRNCFSGVTESEQTLPRLASCCLKLPTLRTRWRQWPSPSPLHLMDHGHGHGSNNDNDH